MNTAIEVVTRAAERSDCQPLPGEHDGRDASLNLMAVPNEFLTVKEFVAIVRISERKYYRMRADGDGPRVTMLGGRHVISRDELRRWCHSHTEANYFQFD